MPASKSSNNKRPPLAILATLASIGYLPAPGSCGSLVAVMAGAWLAISVGIIGLVVATIVLAILAFPAIDAYSRMTQTHDSKHIIIDEVIGQWLTMLAIPVVPAWTADYMVYLVAAFILFRLFDIWKPLFIKAAEDLPGAAGVIADDVLAAVCAGVCLMLGGMAWGG